MQSGFWRVHALCQSTSASNHLFWDVEKYKEFKRQKHQIQAAYCQRQKVSATSDPISAPEAPLPIPNAGPSIQPPARNLDLISTIHGIQVHESANVLTWPNGLQTVVLTLVQDGKNYLEYDKTYLCLIASCPQAVPGGHHIDFIDRRALQDDYDLVMAICQSLSIGHPIVIHDFKDTSRPPLNEDGLYHLFGISPNMLVDIHGADLHFPRFSHSFCDIVDTTCCIVMFHKPHVHGTMSDLITGINDLDQCCFILDIPFTQCGMPLSIKYIAFSYHFLFFSYLLNMLSVSSTTVWQSAGVRHSGIYHSRNTVYVDNLVICSWALAHQAGILMYPHRNTDGNVTYIIGMFGVKLWTSYFALDPTLSHEELQAIAEDLCNPDVHQL